MYYLIYAIALLAVFLLGGRWLVQQLEWRGVLKTQERASAFVAFMLVLLVLLGLLPAILQLPWAIN